MIHPVDVSLLVAVGITFWLVLLVAYLAHAAVER
jgi:hypothetical protein